MENNKRFIKAWYKWQRVDLPVSNFRQKRVKSLTYKIEHDLDHLASYLYTLGESVLSGSKIEIKDIVKGELDELEGINKELDICAIPSNEKIPYVNFINATRDMIEAILNHGVAPRA